MSRAGGKDVGSDGVASSSMADEPYFPSPARRPPRERQPFRDPAPTPDATTSAPRRRAPAARRTDGPRASIAVSDEGPTPTQIVSRAATAILVRVVALLLALGVVSLLVWAAGAFHDSIPPLLPGVALLVLCVVGLPLLLVHRVRRLVRRLSARS